jgi:hypothetical protein
MELDEIVCAVADVLKEFDSEMPIHKSFKAGIGPIGEPQLSSRSKKIRRDDTLLGCEPSIS